MRLRALSFALAAFAVVGAGAWALAGAATRHVERTTMAELAAAFADAGQTWVEVTVDGLAVRLAGTAPDEASRLRAIEAARGIVDAARLGDAITVASPRSAPAPSFALEILRNDDSVSLIGLVPEEAGRAPITAGLAAAGLGSVVTDMLETADHSAPDGWTEALRFALDLLRELDRAKIAVAPGEVTVATVAARDADRETLATRLSAAAPAGVALSLDLAAPRPVLTPFTFGLAREADGTARLLSCSAETEADAAAILTAARAAGLAEERANLAACAIGLGAPSPEWVTAIKTGLSALEQVGGGSFSLSDLDALLVGPPDLDPTRLAEAGAALDGALPAVFALATQGAARAGDGEANAVVHAPEFRATLLADGSVRLAGPLAARSSQIAVVGFAEALFGHEQVMNTTVIDPHLPEGWPGRVLGGIEALALLAEGTLSVTLEETLLEGTSVIEAAEEEIAGLYAGRELPPPRLALAFDPTAALPALPRPDPVLAEATARREAAVDLSRRVTGRACAAQIESLLADEMILFESGSATIDAESADVVEAIADVLAGCPGTTFEIGGHTDSRGSAEVNQRLSEARAMAVLEALTVMGGLEDVTLTAVGYGPDEPVADNDTAEGRALNRRIAFALVDPPGAEGGEAEGSDDPD